MFSKVSIKKFRVSPSPVSSSEKQSHDPTWSQVSTTLSPSHEEMCKPSLHLSSTLWMKMKRYIYLGAGRVQVSAGGSVVGSGKSGWLVKDTTLLCGLALPAPGYSHPSLPAQWGPAWALWYPGLLQGNVKSSGNSQLFCPSVSFPSYLLSARYQG